MRHPEPRADDESASADQVPTGLRRVWGIPNPVGTRGPKASLTLDSVLDVAVALGDAEGLDAISLTGVATRLGVTTNALYRYLDSRDELHALARERALGPAVRTGDPRDDWRAAVTDWAVALRARYRAHPWMADLRIRVPVTPNSLDWFEALLEALAPSSFGTVERVRIGVLLDGYVRASAVASRDLAEQDPPVSSGSPVLAAIEPMLAGRGLPLVAELFAAGIYQEPADATNEVDFRFGLDCIIRGLADVAAAAGTPASP